MRRRERIGLLLLLATTTLAVAPTRAHAQMCSRALSVRIGPRGLGFIAETVKPLVPTSIDVPDVDKVVLDWPITDNDARVKMSGVKASVDLKDLRIFSNGTSLHLAAVVDVGANGPVQIDNPYVGFGSASCQLDVALKKLSVDVGARIDMDAGHVKVEITDAKIDFDEQASRVALTGCTLGEVLSAVVKFIKNHFSGAIKSLAEKIARDRVPPLLEARLAGTLEKSGQINDVSYTARLDALKADFNGVQADIGAQLGFAAPAGGAPCLAGVDTTPPATCNGPAPQLSAGIETMFAAGINEALLQSVVHSAWRAGKLCIDSDALAQSKPELLSKLDGLGTMLGQPAGTKMSFQVKIGRAPRVRISEAFGLLLDLDELEISMQLTPPNAPAGGMRILASLTVGAKPSVSPESGAITVSLRQAVVKRMELLGAQPGTPGFGMDPARLTRFIDTVGMPLLQKRMGEIQLSPSVIGLEGLAQSQSASPIGAIAGNLLVELKQIQMRDGYAAAYLDVHRKQVTDDRQPPATSIVEAPNGIVGPAMIKIVVTGNDNETPAALLRYRYRLDGGQWSETTYNRRIDVVAAAGQHEVEIAAVDQQGNVDSSPVRVVYSVDENPPDLQVSKVPPNVLEEPTATVHFSGSDDITPAAQLAYRAELFRQPQGGGAPELVSQGEWLVGAAFASMQPTGDGIYTMRVTVRDGAGNVTSKDFGFVVHSGGGCSVGASPSTATSTLPLLLGLLALVGIARRRRRRRSAR
ncbi:MAG: hypothetical protein KC503_00710 [Myxococcales bacterium]|nr:hypothetical protein [Myxococcales bacterium]